MEKYAIIKLGGKQFMVQEGTQFTIERQGALKPEVLLFSDGKDVLVGQPVLAEISVKMEFVEKDTKAAKIRVGRFRNKSRHRRVKGHQQPISIVKVKTIENGSKAEKTEKAEKAEAKKPAAKKTVKSSTEGKASARTRKVAAK